MKYSEKDPIIVDLLDSIESELEDTGAQNYEANVEPAWDDENETIIGISIRVWHNVDWTDREGRHPWLEIYADINFKKKKITAYGTIESKDGRIDNKEKIKPYKFKSKFIPKLGKVIYDIVNELENNLDGTC